VKRLLVILVLAVPALAAQRKCKENPKVVGACYSIRGRLQFGADTVRYYLRPVGTKRMLGVTGGPRLDDADDPILPSDLKRSFGEVEAIYGEFEVCPFTLKQEGAMQLVCVESAKQLVLKRWPASTKQ
jgi:hypothetical protein